MAPAASEIKVFSSFIQGDKKWGERLFSEFERADKANFEIVPVTIVFVMDSDVRMSDWDE